MTGIKTVLLLAGLLASGLVTSYAVIGSHSASAPPAPPTGAPALLQGVAPVNSDPLPAGPDNIPPIEPRAMAAARARVELAMRRRRTRESKP
jgi:hypothetical protein